MDKKILITNIKQLTKPLTEHWRDSGELQYNQALDRQKQDLTKIVERNRSDFGTYDYKQIAEDLIKYLKDK